MAEIGPVQLISIGFDRDANFEGKVIDELRSSRASERSGFSTSCSSPATRTRRTRSCSNTPAPRSSAGSWVPCSASSSRARPSRRPPAVARSTPSDSPSRTSRRWPPASARESAGLLLIEHVWARDLRRAFRDAGGRMLGEGFLTPETIRAVEPELAAISDAIAAAGARRRPGLRSSWAICRAPNVRRAGGGVRLRGEAGGRTLACAHLRPARIRGIQRIALPRALRGGVIASARLGDRVADAPRRGDTDGRHCLRRSRTRAAAPRRRPQPAR